jgi:hypothetical protein
MLAVGRSQSVADDGGSGFEAAILVRVAGSMSAATRIAPVLWLVPVFGFAFSCPAAALDFECRGWTRLSYDEKLATLDRTIEDVLSSSRGRAYRSINRTRTQRCLESNRDRIIDDFDDTCSRGMRASMNALNETFISYVWSCAQ